jgi:hypothetical protein
MRVSQRKCYRLKERLRQLTRNHRHAEAQHRKCANEGLGPEPVLREELEVRPDLMKQQQRVRFRTSATGKWMGPV